MIPGVQQLSTDKGELGMGRLAFLTFALVAFSATVLFAVDGQTPPPKPGDLVAVTITGEMAKEYTVRKGLPHVDGCEVSTIAKIAQVLEGGKLRIEQSMPIKREGKPEQLFTLEAVVGQKDVTIHVTPKGTEIYASPGDHKKVKPRGTTEETSYREVRLSKAEGIKLRVWTLTDELNK